MRRRRTQIFRARFDPGLPTDCTYHTVVLDSQCVNQTNEETWMEIALYYAPNTCALAPLCHLDRGGRRFRGPAAQLPQAAEFLGRVSEDQSEAQSAFARGRRQDTDRERRHP